ncbi:glycoside hydrolase family 108 protein [Microvirga sesbaniae]|uniref:glycoside hydrolase family 108 protein n=1 Tax=Microvirga sesbaniae TaxID=681392 RepID=UPI0021C72088|nr:glycosyl hydrolase 108 family protein [Microvirga sp. HBU67692]
MAAVNVPGALALVLRIEGGYVDHPQDPGGATKYGITLATLSACRGRRCTKADMRALTEEEAGAIYRARYWDRVRADELPPGIDEAVFDFAVNSGPSRAVIALQRALGVADDGVPGPVTLAAARRANPRKVVNAICDDRLAMMRRLSTWKTFGKGWSRRVAAVRAAALALTDAPPTLAERAASLLKRAA